MLRSVVVPLDGSAFAERAISPAVGLAERHGAEVVVLTAQEGRAFDADRYLAGVLSRHPAARPKVAPILTASDAILEAARSDETIVCMASHGEGGPGASLLGSTAYHVLRHSPGPTILIGPGYEPGWLTASGSVVIVGSDGSERSLAIARDLPALASAWRARARIFEVVKPEGLRDLSGETDGHPWALRQLASLFAGSGIEAEFGTIEGWDPVEELVAEARRWHAIAIAVALERRWAVDGVPFSGMTMPIVHDAPCPVLVVNPALRPARA